jgi:hypothetical protein
MEQTRVNPLRLAYHWLKLRLGGGGQSNESAILKTLAGPTRTFVEFGFHPTEFNCIGFRATHNGLLIDGDPRTVALGRFLLPRHLKVVHRFLTLENLCFVETAFPRIGILSIDVDGNDFWFLERLLPTKPEVICVEYNASFGHESVTVPYDPAFNRHEKHASGWYHGASLSALARLCGRFGYGLAAVSDAGGNAFFTPSGTLDPAEAYRESRLRNEWSRNSAAQQWETVRHLPLTPV